MNVNKQLCGNERREAVEKCLIESNGSSNDYADKLIGGEVLAGEELQIDIDVKSKKFKDVMRKAISQYMNE